MFKSEFSGKQVDKHTSPVRVVTHKRKKFYTDDKGYTSGQGWEIVKEISVSPDEVEAVKAKFGEGGIEVASDQKPPVFQIRPPVESTNFRRRDRDDRGDRGDRRDRDREAY